jgi:hypothetical protein
MSASSFQGRIDFREWLARSTGTPDPRGFRSPDPRRWSSSRSPAVIVTREKGVASETAVTPPQPGFRSGPLATHVLVHLRAQRAPLALDACDQFRITHPSTCITARSNAGLFVTEYFGASGNRVGGAGLCAWAARRLHAGLRVRVDAGRAVLMVTAPYSGRPLPNRNPGADSAPSYGRILARIGTADRTGIGPGASISSSSDSVHEIPGSRFSSTASRISMSRSSASSGSRFCSLCETDLDDDGAPRVLDRGFARYARRISMTISPASAGSRFCSLYETVPLPRCLLSEPGPRAGPGPCYPSRSGPAPVPNPVRSGTGHVHGTRKSCHPSAIDPQ